MTSSRWLDSRSKTKAELLATLWLHEPDEARLESAVKEYAFPQASVQELAVAYSDLFLLNVYPYASVFLDPEGEMNGVRAHQVQQLYKECRYEPRELNEVGAADHIGLLLSLAAARNEGRALLYLLDWAPVLCLAVERTPTAHPFYRALAVHTREWLWQQTKALPPLHPNPAMPLWERQPLEADEEQEQEFDLRALVHYLLTPGHCGIFLTRAQLGLWARALGVPLAFGERFQMGRTLLEGVGALGQVGTLFEWLRLEAAAWDEAYAQWAMQAHWHYAEPWRERIQDTFYLLTVAKQLGERIPPLEND